MPDPASEPLPDTPSEADWSRASGVLDWLYKVTGNPDVQRISYLLDDTMRDADA